MAHKFAEKWRSFVLRQGVWDYDGEMDLTTMDQQGHLEDGKHPHGFKLKGDALGGELLTLHTDPPGITYSGFLIFENGNKMTLIGREHFDSLEAREKFARRESLAPLDQEDPPWVITKP